MNNNRECAAYFKDQKVYHRCFLEFWKKWRSYGKVAGKIALSDTSPEERKAIGGIVGKTFWEEKIQFTFAEFEAGLQKTRFAPVDMQSVLEEYFGKKLETSQVEQEKYRKEKLYFLDKILDYFVKTAGENCAAAKWLKCLKTEKKYGYQLLLREYGKHKALAERLAKNVGMALQRLYEMQEKPGEYKLPEDIQESCPLAVFAAEISDNPHYFDRGSTGGTLLVHGICFMEKEKMPENAHRWRELLENAGIIPDNVSSLVHAYGLRLQTDEGWHPAYEAFCRRKEPYVITMENLRGIVGAESVKKPYVEQAEKKVYVVENEMVFTYLLSNLRDRYCTLLCTSGQPRAVAQQLIPMILKSGAQIYYSGDIDPDGIRIAERLWQRFGSGIHIWRMSPQDYEKSSSGEKIGESGLRKLENIENPKLKQTADAVREKGFAGYQENILELLLKDISG